MSRKLEYMIEPEYDGIKVYDYLRGKLKFSSTIIKRLKTAEDGILLDNKHIRTIDLLKSGSVLEINIPEDERIADTGDVFAPVLYEDEDIVAFDKPAFMPVHPTRNHQCDTLGNAYASYMLKTCGSVGTFRPINRLDRDTTGIVVCGKNPYSASVLNGRISKIYYAVVCGELNGSGTIDAPIYRPDPMKIMRCVSEKGSRAVTHWESVHTNSEFSLLKIQLETGRTHQIRVHFSYSGHPLVGDTMYGTADERISRQALHCAEASFIHPVTNESVSIISEIPDDMKKLLY